MQETVLVAGGAGFIGSHLCESLLNQQYHVLCVDNLTTGDKKNIEPLLQQEHFKFIEHDIIQPLDSTKYQGESIHYIFHLASPASPNKNSRRSYIQKPFETLLVNSTGTYHLLELAQKQNAKFLYASTSEVYGDPQVSPQPETYRGNVSPNGPRSVYDEAKRFGEACTMAFVREHNMDARIVRIFNTYGPHMQKDDGRLVSNFINQALVNQPITIYGEGKQTRSFCYVSDMVRGLEKLMFTGNTKGEVVNLGNPDERTVLDMAHLIKQLTQSSSKIVYQQLPEDDPMQRKPDISKAKHLLDWSPSVTLEEGLKKIIEYFKNFK